MFHIMRAVAIRRTYLRVPHSGHRAQCAVIDSVWPQFGQAVFGAGVRAIGLPQPATALSAISRSSDFESGGCRFRLIGRSSLKRMSDQAVALYPRD